MTDACNCVWLSVGSKITMPAQHPSLVSVAVIKKNDENAAWGEMVYFFTLDSPSQRALMQEFKGGTGNRN